MTQQEINEYNKRCAEFLGWKYVSSIDVKEGIYHTTIKAGWYSEIPKVLHYKINRHLYKSRSLKHMYFHSDWNWIMEVIEAIEKLKYAFEIVGNYIHIIGTGIYLVRETKKEAVVKAINQFLIWHEQNK